MDTRGSRRVAPSRHCPSSIQLDELPEDVSGPAEGVLEEIARGRFSSEQRSNPRGSMAFLRVHPRSVLRMKGNPPEPKRFRGKEAPPPCGERRAALPSGVEEVHGGGTSKRDAYVRHGKVCEIRYSSSAH